MYDKGFYRNAEFSDGGRATCSFRQIAHSWPEADAHVARRLPVASERNWLNPGACQLRNQLTWARVERLRMQAEFIARGLRSHNDVRRAGDYVDADEVIDGLQRKLDAVRPSLAKQGK